MSEEQHSVIDRDLGKVRVLSDKCGDCVLRPGNLMRLRPGALQDLIDSNVQAGSGLICHQTLSYAPHDVDPAWCRGFFDAYPNTWSVQIARDYIGLVEVPPPVPFVENETGEETT